MGEENSGIQASVLLIEGVHILIWGQLNTGFAEVFNKAQSSPAFDKYHYVF